MACSGVRTVCTVLCPSPIRGEWVSGRPLAVPLAFPRSRNSLRRGRYLGTMKYPPRTIGFVFTLSLHISTEQCSQILIIRRIPYISTQTVNWFWVSLNGFRVFH